MEIQMAWGSMLEDIYHIGEMINKDGQNVKEVLYNHFFLDNVMKPFSDYCSGHESNIFLKMLAEGQFDILEYPLKGEALADYVKSYDNKDIILLNQNFVYSYPERLKHMLSVTKKNEIKFINQIDVMIQRLVNNPESNRAVAVLYNAGLDYDIDDIPCLNHIQVFIRDEEVVLYCLFRSNDIYGAFISNMYLLQYIGLKITDELGKYYPNLKFKGVQYTSYSAHIYEEDLPMVKKILGL